MAGDPIRGELVLLVSFREPVFQEAFRSIAGLAFPDTERRATRRYRVSLRVQTWAESGKRSASVLVSTRDLSLRGLYLTSASPFELEGKFHFAVLAPDVWRSKRKDLFSGLASHLRREERYQDGTARFGLAAKIEELHKLHGEKIPPGLRVPKPSGTDTIEADAWLKNYKAIRPQ